jgi:cell division protein FtsB
MRNGRASFLAWVISLAAYIACRFAKIEAPEVTYGLIGFTGLLVGNLGIAQGKRNARVEERSVETRRQVRQLEDDAETSRDRADESERRERQWSKHKDHVVDGDDDG